MTPEQLDAFLRVAREHGCTRLKVGEVEAELSPLVTKPAEERKPEPPPKDQEEHWARVERDIMQGPIA